jgi:NAD(P)-dependent dehydrogenase (short-subunit alcohol dehydrogenase family)
LSTVDPERDRVAVVSGAGTGIGQAIATKLGALGWHVGIGGRRVEKLDETRSLVEDAGGTAIAHPLDVTDPESVDEFFTAVEEHTGPVSVVINNAATARYGPLDDFAPAEINAEISTKLTGSLYMARRGIISMKHGGVPGDILFITSTSAAEPWPHHLPYGAASAGAEHAARILGLELEGSGIRVTTLRVSNTAGTDFATRELGTERMDAANRVWFRHARLRHTGLMTPEMVADAVVSAVTLPRTLQFDILSVAPLAPAGPLPATYDELVDEMIRRLSA